MDLGQERKEVVLFRMVENVQKCLGLLFWKGGNVVFERIRFVLLTFLETNVEQKSRNGSSQWDTLKS